MNERLDGIGKSVAAALQDLQKAMPLREEHLLVVGTSTSEVIGEKIGTSGTPEVAREIYLALQEFREETGVALAFQCCEHLNRSLVVERSTAKNRGYEIVSVIPIRSAGGAMATYAYQKMSDPVVVEAVRADAGIDIGQTLIGMHLRPVAVPVRSRIRQIGHAPLTLARTRPKLIGGERAVYPEKQQIDRF